MFTKYRIHPLDSFYRLRHAFFFTYFPFERNNKIKPFIVKRLKTTCHYGDKRFSTKPHDIFMSAGVSQMLLLTTCAVYQCSPIPCMQNIDVDRVYRQAYYYSLVTLLSSTTLNILDRNSYYKCRYKTTVYIKFCKQIYSSSGKRAVRKYRHHAQIFPTMS